MATYVGRSSRISFCHSSPHEKDRKVVAILLVTLFYYDLGYYLTILG